MQKGRFDLPSCGLLLIGQMQLSNSFSIDELMKVYWSPMLSQESFHVWNLKAAKTFGDLPVIWKQIFSHLVSSWTFACICSSLHTGQGSPASQHHTGISTSHCTSSTTVLSGWLCLFTWRTGSMVCKQKDVQKDLSQLLFEWRTTGETEARQWDIMGMSQQLDTNQGCRSYVVSLQPPKYSDVLF